MLWLRTCVKLTIPDLHISVQHPWKVLFVVNLSVIFRFPHSKQHPHGMIA